MVRNALAALPPLVLLCLAGLPAASHAQGLDRPAPLEVRTACDPDGRCYETGDPSYRDDDMPPPPRHRFDDEDRPPPPPRRFEPDDDERPPPPRHRYYRDDDD